jgi:hypothetical protein
LQRVLGKGEFRTPYFSRVIFASPQIFSMKSTRPEKQVFCCGEAAFAEKPFRNFLQWNQALIFAEKQFCALAEKQ